MVLGHEKLFILCATTVLLVLRRRRRRRRRIVLVSFNLGRVPPYRMINPLTIEVDHKGSSPRRQVSIQHLVAFFDPFFFSSLFDIFSL